ncbi:MAG: hypothetical protein ACPGQ5_10780 [Alphaproteobacteria bacterium]
MIRTGTIILAAAMISFAPPAQAGACAEANITISAPPLSHADQRDFVEKFRASVAKVCTWWGGEFAGPYRIEIDESHSIEMAMIPSWRGDRGQVIFPMRTVRQGISPITHEIVHVIAPNGNRFLAEGLAVHAHDALGGQAAFPNFGDDLHMRAAALTADADMAALERIAAPAGLRLPDLRPRDAYLAAGSFVRFLIQEHGMEKFRELYAITPLVERGRFAGVPERWQGVYGQSFDELVAAWRAAIGS